ncbi:hypothetical protein DSCO28_72900 (plasmid) [Desulfosarcina ovata subsp. sediminis]|uniref:Uncharacterized protein n=1 Tax=Desulfosarcina ovata subsp. sediminis TaxID=885957 RepID=A0A5K8A2Z5_9BACT|nr:hypothetical protein DSCO28_72900 [Desulfosarcina ovata subsp. sediminis]
MQNKNLPETYKGYPTKRLLKIWEEIATPDGTSAPKEEIEAMGALLREYRLGVHGAMDQLKSKGPPSVVKTKN